MDKTLRMCQTKVKAKRRYRARAERRQLMYNQIKRDIQADYYKNDLTTTASGSSPGTFRISTAGTYSKQWTP